MLSKTSWKQLHINPTDITIGTCKGGTRLKVNEYLTIKNVITYISNISKVENLISVEAYHKIIDKNTVDILGDIYVRNKTVRHVAETAMWGKSPTRWSSMLQERYTVKYFDEVGPAISASKPPIGFRMFRFHCSGFEIQACIQAMRDSYVEYRNVQKDGTFSQWKVCKRIPRSPHYDSLYGYIGVHVLVDNVLEDYSQTDIEVRLSDGCQAMAYDAYTITYNKAKSSETCDVLYTIITEKK